MTTQPTVESPPSSTNWRQTPAAIIAARIADNQIVPDAEGTISGRDAARIAQVSERLIRNWGEEGEIPWISRKQENRTIHRYPLDGVIACAERRAYLPQRPGRGRLSNQELAAAAALSERSGAADREELGESEAEAKGAPVAPSAYVGRRAGVPKRPGRVRPCNQELAAAVVLSEQSAAADLEELGESEAEAKGATGELMVPVAPTPVPTRRATDRLATPVSEGAAGLGDHETIEAPPASPIPFRTPNPAPLADRQDAPLPQEWISALLRETRENRETLAQMGAELRGQAAVLARVVENQNAQLVDQHERERRQQAEITHLQATVSQQLTLLHQYHEVLGATRGLTLLASPAATGGMDRPSAIPHPFPRP